MVAEVREWLHELRRTDRVTANLVGQAITAIPLAEERYATYLKERTQP